jgi:NADPH-dependent 2,4-dienoyl-CoA reductase/sulfur reductase-like enzyme
MEAARVAAQRGHRVSLIEKRSEFGGMVAALAREPLTAASVGDIQKAVSTANEVARASSRPKIAS